MTPDQIVTEFIGACTRNDMDAACAYLADDVVYDNVPIGAMTGPAAVASTLGPFNATFDEIDWVIHHQVATGTAAEGVVLNERADRFRRGDTWVQLDVAGVFEIRDGRITLWRDYFDIAAFQRAFAPPSA